MATAERCFLEMKASAAMRRLPHRRRMRDVHARVMAAEREKVRDEIAKLKADFEIAHRRASRRDREDAAARTGEGYTDFLRILDRPRDDAAWSQTRRRARLARRIACLRASRSRRRDLISKLAKTAPLLPIPPGKRGQLALRAYPCSRRNAP